MPLDWLFGGKKKSEQEAAPTDENKANSSGDDFVLLDGDQPSGRANVYPDLPYTVSPQAVVAPASGSTSPETAVQSLLSGVPFKLAANDTSLDLNAASASQAGASLFISYLNENMSSGSFSYDFQVEKSVLQEAGCRDLG